MALKQNKNRAVGADQPFVDAFPFPIVANRDPQDSDRAERGTIWVNQTTNTSFLLASVANNISTWRHIDGGSEVTVASPGTTATFPSNTFSGAAIFTGFTTAAGASEEFTIESDVLTADSRLLVTVANTGINDAQMTLTRVEPGVDDIVIDMDNNGAAALNGSIIITWKILQF